MTTIRLQRLQLVLGASLAALAFPALAFASHLPGFGHDNTVLPPNGTGTACSIDSYCLGAENSVGGSNAIGIWGRHTATHGTGPGVYGETNAANALAAGVKGHASANGVGVFGTSVSGYGVRAESLSTAVVAQSTSQGFGVLGDTASQSPNAAGILGRINSNAAGSAGVYGLNSGTGAFGIGMRGEHSGGGNGVYGSVAQANVGAAGVLGQVLGTAGGGVGVHGHHGGGGYGVYGNAVGPGSVGVAGNQGNATGYAGYFAGRVLVTGMLTKGGGAFKIDHPLDPANKYLQHSFVESPDMMNVYNGNVRTNAKGLATVKLPRYFSALNRDFRYQLTIVGRRFADALVWNKIANNRFTIRTDRPNVEVSWQVTGIRKDRWANANRIQVEQAKSSSEQGKYLNPELYGSAAKSVVALPRLNRQH